MQTTLTLIDKETNKYKQHVTFYAPTTDEGADMCSITLEPVGHNPETLLGVKIGSAVVPLKSKPTCVAARLSCGHCFNGMAVLVHFAKNSMECPLCRCGSSEHTLDLSQSFPSEPWVPALQNSILASNMAAHASALPTSILLGMRSADLGDIPVHATFVLYNNHPITDDGSARARFPTVAMRCRLEIIPQMPFLDDDPMTLASWFTTSHPPPLQYRLPSVFARLLQDHINDMHAAQIHIHVYAAYQGIVFDMAQMHATPYPFANDFVPCIEPASERISFRSRHNHVTDDAPTLQYFLYEPSRTIITNVLHLLLDLF